VEDGNPRAGIDETWMRDFF